MGQREADAVMNDPTPHDAGAINAADASTAAVETVDRRGVLVQWWLPSTVITLVALGHALYLRALVENPYQLSIFFHLFRVQELPAAWLWLAILTVGTVAALWSARLRLQPAIDWLGNNARLVGLIMLGVLVPATQLVYRDFPLSMDEYGAFFQSQVFAAGELTGRFPAGSVTRFVPPSFLDFFFYAGADGRIVATYWPGHALLMAPFTRIGAPWLLNPLFTVGAFWLMVTCARRLCGGSVRAGGWAALFCLASPELWVNGITYYSMPAHLFCNLLFAWLLFEPRSWRLVAAGVVGSLAVTLHQPVPHAMFALPWGIWLLTRNGGLRRILLVGLGYLPLTLLLGVGWVVLRADVRSPDHDSRSISTTMAPGSETPPATAQEVVSSPISLSQVVELPFTPPTLSLLWVRCFNFLKLWLWTAPGLPLLALLAGYGLLRGSVARSSGDRTLLLLLCGSALATFTAYLFVPYDQGHGWGYRYFYSSWAVLPILGAAKMNLTGPPRSRATGLAIALAALIAAPVGLSLRMLQVRLFIDSQRMQVPTAESLEPGYRWLVFIDPRRGYYRGDLIRNDPFLRDPTWMMVSHDRQSDQALARVLLTDVRLVRATEGESIWRAPLK